jgi:predicted phage terminase large subunit-like protein
MMKDRLVRTSITKDSFLYFFHFYYAHYVKYETADFQKEIMHYLEKSPTENLYIVAFRGAGKSVLVTTAYPIWAILGKQQKKFCLIICQTRAQAKQHMMNIRNELESNDVLKRDLGPFKEESDEWGSHTLVFNKHNARITIASTDQSIRGARHNQHRPDLIICDDIEDVQSTRTREGRDKTYQWFTGEVVPTGDHKTRVIIIGNLLHEDSLLMRIKEGITAERIDGVFKEYPLIQYGEILWLGKYPNMQAVEVEKRKMGNEFAWQREYLLVIIPAEDQAIDPDWIQYYDEIPPEGAKDSFGYDDGRHIRIGVDLAISQEDTADYTAMVPIFLFGNNTDFLVFVLPDIINRRMTFPETVDTCKVLSTSYNHTNGAYPTFFIEDVGYQKSLPQQLVNDGVPQVKSVRPGSYDKRTRLIMTANMIKSGQIKFPRHGAEQLIEQIVHFGVEKHDDLVDAFVNGALSVVQDPPIVERIGFF